MEWSFLELDDPRWMQLLSQTPHAPHHLPGYVALAAAHEGGTPCAFWAKSGECELLLPLIIRKIPQLLTDDAEWSDAATPYGYAGPLVFPYTRKCNSNEREYPDAAAAIAPLLRSLCEGCAERRLISVFARTSPMLNVPLAPFAETGSLVRHADTVYIDLSLEEAELTRRIRRSYRYEVKKLEELHLSAVMDNPDYLNAFTTLYNDLMGRLGAAQAYFIEPDYARRVMAMPGAHNHLTSFVTQDGEVVAGLLCLEACGIADSFLFGATEPYRRKSVYKAALVESMRRFKEWRYELFHLGGGVDGNEDNLKYFKLGFSPLTASFYTWRFVCDKDSYETLVCRSERVSAPSDGSFFPAYRRERSISSLEAPS